MKALTLIFLALLTSALSHSQCGIIVSLEIPESTCGITSATVTASADISSCPEAEYYEYTWETFSYIGDYSIISGELNMGELTTSLEITYEQQIVFVSFTVNILDSDLNLVGTATDILSVDNYFPATLPESNIDFTCGNHCFQVDTTYLNDNVTFTLNGNPLSYYSLMSYNCMENPGIYQLVISDQNGCTDSFTFEVSENISDANGSCESALSIGDYQTLSDELCSPDGGVVSCTNYNYESSSWFVINSEDYTHLNIGITIANYFNVYGIQVWEQVTEGDCSSIELFNCFSPTEISQCFQVTNELTNLQPFTNYYIQVYGGIGQIYDITTQLSYEPSSLCGCTNPNACNYNPDAVINAQYMCQTPGCMDPSACNYDYWADCDNGSCLFGSNLIGQLYHDVNGDGYWQNYGFFAEPALGNTGSIYIQEIGTTVYPNSEGAFVFPELPLNTYTIVYTDNSDVWTTSTGSTFTMTLPSCYGALIGLIPVSETILQVSGPCCIWMMDIHCENGFNPGLWVQNTGTVPLNGTFTMTFDPLFVPAYLSGAEPYDSYSNGVMVWNIENQMPGESVLYQCHINGPGFSYMGQVFPFNMILSLVDDEGDVAYSESWLLEPEVVCSYDPNDKYAVPEGYTDEHFILSSDEVEYRIRFQNTGNAPAEDVTIVDHLDISVLDLSTFYPVFGSHDFSTILDSDGTVQFDFNNIMLPDIDSDEPGSQGYVLFRIKTLPGLAGGTEINNTAEIYFDNNPPIITNTTWHTIMDCAELGAIDSLENCCTNTACQFVADDLYLESIQWQLDDEFIGYENTVEYTFDEAGEFGLFLIGQNPLCMISNQIDIIVNPSPDSEIEQSGDVLTAGSGISWQWYHNGELIVGATSQDYSPLEDGFGQGTFWCIITNESGCTTQSESVLYSSHIEITSLEILLYPNPADDAINLILPDGHHEIVIFNSIGEEVLRATYLKSNPTLDIRGLASGYYILSSTDGISRTSIPFSKSE